MILFSTVPTIFVIARIVNDAEKGIEKGIRSMKKKSASSPKSWIVISCSCRPT